MTRPVTSQITVDVIIEMSMLDGNPIVLIERKYEPFGWAIPGGFVDVGETVATAAQREALEETCLNVDLNVLLGIYSDPKRDLRGQTAGVVFVGRLPENQWLPMMPRISLCLIRLTLMWN